MKYIYYLKANERWLLMAIALGCAMRLIYPSDMEWTLDEKYYYTVSSYYKNISLSDWLLIGPLTSQGFYGPAGCIWLLTGISFFAQSPTGMVQVVMLMNVMPIILSTAFSLLKCKGTYREYALWTIALYAVSPTAILYSRKIWPQDLLTFFSFIIIFTYYYRRFLISAFLCGLFLSLIGQIHLSGYFFSASFILTALFLKKDSKNILIVGFLGLSIGLLPSIQYFVYITTQAKLEKLSLVSFFDLSFIWHFLKHSIGLGSLNYLIKGDFITYIKLPLIFNVPSYLVGISHLSLIIIGIVLVMRSGKWIVSVYSRNWLDVICDKRYFFVNITVVIFLLFMLSFHKVYDHYLIVLFIVPQLYLVKIFENEKKILLLCLLCELIISSSYLYWNHTHCGHGEGYPADTYYGVTYRCNPDIALSRIEYKKFELGQ